MANATLNPARLKKVLEALEGNWQAEMESCHTYKALADRDTEPSMSRPGNPCDNAKAESFTDRPIPISPTPDPASAPSSKPSPTPTASIPRSAYASPIAFQEAFRKTENRNREIKTALSIN